MRRGEKKLVVRVVVVGLEDSRGGRSVLNFGGHENCLFVFRLQNMPFKQLASHQYPIWATKVTISLHLKTLLSTQEF